MHAFDVLGDPVRRRILELLADGEQTSGAITAVIQAEFGISQPAVSQHLRVLRENGFATVRADGTRRLYAVDAAPLREVDVWLDRFRRFWSQHLDALATELARGKRERRRRDEEHPPRRERPMIDIVSQLDAIRREVAKRPRTAARSSASCCGAVRRGRRGRLGRDDRPGPAEALVPAGQRRPARGRHVPARGQRRRRDPACEPPRLLRVTFGGETSIVELRLSTGDGDGPSSSSSTPSRSRWPAAARVRSTSDPAGKDHHYAGRGYAFDLALPTGFRLGQVSDADR